MLGWLKQILWEAASKKTAPPMAVAQEVPLRLDVSGEFLKPPIFAIDLDAKGQPVLCLIHVTSSANKNSIISGGLIPEATLRQRLLDYLRDLYPEDDPLMLLSAIESAGEGPWRGSALLVTGRLFNCDDHEQPIYLLPIGSSTYLGSAGENAAKDGGEIFKAARVAINSIFMRNAGPKFPDAVPVVFLCQIPLSQEEGVLKAAEIPELSIDIESPGTYDFFVKGDSEIRVHKKISPNCLQCFELEDYLRREKRHISSEALRRTAKA